MKQPPCTCTTDRFLPQHAHDCPRQQPSDIGDFDGDYDGALAAERTLNFWASRYRTTKAQRDEALAKLAAVDDLTQRLAFLDDAGQAVMRSHEQMHRRHAEAPYIGCFFCRDKFVSTSELEAERAELRATADGLLPRLKDAEAEVERLCRALERIAETDWTEPPIDLPDEMARDALKEKRP